jgi:hypothetical protein
MNNHCHKPLKNPQLSSCHCSHLLPNYHSYSDTEQAGAAEHLMTCIWEILGSNLSQVIGFSEAFYGSA